MASDSQLYHRAYSGVVDMLAARGCRLDYVAAGASSDGSDGLQGLQGLRKTPAEIAQIYKEDNTLGNLEIKGVRDSHGRQVYVKFYTIENNIAGSRKVKSPGGLSESLEKAGNHFQTNDPSLEKLDLKNMDIMKKYNERARMILIIDYPPGKPSPLEKSVKAGDFLQFFTVKEMAINIMSHFLQPKFTLLQSRRDALELKELALMNGRKLEDDKLLQDYEGLKENSRLLLIF